MSIKIFETNFIKYLFYLFPILLVTGPLLPDLFIIILSLLFVFHLINENNFTYFKNSFFIFFSILCLIIFLSVFFISPAPLEKQGTSIFYLRFGFFVLFIKFFFTNEKNLFIF